MKTQMREVSMRNQSSLKSGLLVLAFGLLISACSDKSKPNVELIQDMMESPAIKSQEGDKDSPQHRGMRLPPEGSVPVGFKPYTDDAISAKNLKNPISTKMDPEVLKVGQKYFEINCAICHGIKGKGDGIMAEKMPLKPPTLHSEKIKNWADGEIYNVITKGQGIMGPYANHIPQDKRWQVVNYIRDLQSKN